MAAIDTVTQATGQLSINGSVQAFSATATEGRKLLIYAPTSSTNSGVVYVLPVVAGASAPTSTAVRNGRAVAATSTSPQVIYLFDGATLKDVYAYGTSSDKLNYELLN